MNFKSISTITAALLITTFTSIELSSAAGRSTTAVVNTILNGKGAPKNSLGIDGDFYIDTRSLLLFGPKTKGKWPTPQSIQGPTGPSGSDGKNGSDGKAISSNNVNNIAGPVGPQGPMGATGAPGPQGEKGETGAAGPAGSSGANGSTGASGPQGPAGATGPQGPIGLTGATGAKGETGTVGPSEVAVVEIPNFTLGTSVGYTFASSDLFGSLNANSSYKFDIYIRSYSNLVGAVLGADLLAAGGVVDFVTLRADTRNATYSTAPAAYAFLLTGTIRVGSSNSSLVVRVIDAYGDTGANPLVFGGKAYITLVGAIR